MTDKTYIPLIYEPDRDRVLQAIASINRANPTATVENRVWAKGEVRWTQWNNRLIFDEAGNFAEYQSVGRDITALKKTEAKLRESEARFRLAFEDAATGEALVSPEGKFIKVNRSLCEIVGYSEEELLGKSFQEITYPEDLDLDLSYVRRMLSGEIRTYQMEKRYFHKQGHLVWILLNASLIRDDNGKVLYFLAQIQNINQRKHVEARLNKLVKELERSNRELDEFASVVSHDLISPVRKQKLFIELLQEDYQDNLDEQGQEYLVRMIGLNLRMERLIHSLLTYARVTTQAKPFVTVPLNQVVDDVLYELDKEITQAQAQIEVGELPTVKGDRLQLRQLLQNLLQNALKFRSQQRSPLIKIYHEPNEMVEVDAKNNSGFKPVVPSNIENIGEFKQISSRNKTTPSPLEYYQTL